MGLCIETEKPGRRVVERVTGAGSGNEREAPLAQVLPHT